MENPWKPYCRCNSFQAPSTCMIERKMEKVGIGWLGDLTWVLLIPKKGINLHLSKEKHLKEEEKNHSDPLNLDSVIIGWHTKQK